MSSIIDFLGELFAWLRDFLLWLPLKILELFLDGFAAVIEAIPVPAFLEDVQNVLGGIDSEAAFFLEAFMIPEGLTIALAAYLARFVVRRLPFIG